MGLVGVTSRIVNENQYKFMFRSPRNFFWPECSMIRERLNADHGPIHVPTSSLIIRRCPAMDDSPTKSTGKFRCHVCYMTNAINTFCCRCFDFFCMQISYDGRQSCKTHTRIQTSCLLHDKCDQCFLLPSLWLLTLEDSLRWTTVLQSSYENSDFMFVI